jgi:hypothetical protein
MSDFHSLIILPMTANFLIGSSVEHKFEIGAGVSTTFALDGIAVPILTGSIGYRYHPALNGFLFRAVFTPLYGSSVQGGILPWGGLSIGYVF